MKWFPFRGIVLMLTVLSLVLGTFATPMSAAPMATETTMSAADEMPCPAEKTVDFDCERACPLMKVCMGSCFLGDTTRSSATLTAQAKSDLLFPARYDSADHLTSVPPSPPPEP